MTFARVVDVKRCITCQQEKSLSEFNAQPNAPDGLRYSCKLCQAAQAKRRYQENREHVAARHAAWYIANRQEVAVKRRQRSQQVKYDVIQHYGGKCACCGETEFIFLTLDHVNQDGASDRRERGYNCSARHYRDIQREGYPKGKYQILCFNCNCGRQLNGGVCPHVSRV